MKRAVLLTMAVLTLLSFTGGAVFAHDTTISMTEENNSGQSGTAVLTDMGDGTTMVSIDVSGGSAVPQPAHIHAGQCGPTLNPRPEYPLSNVVNGKSETIVEVDLHDLTEGTYAINVHKSAAEASIYVSCGNIVAETQHGDDEGTPGMPRTGGSNNILLVTLLALGLSMTTGGLVLSRRRI